MKRILSLLVLLLCLFCLSASAEPEEMPDFTVQTLNGTFSLQDVLQEKKMVLINFFASWCGPCKMEFPYMEQAYEQYADSVAVLALSVEPKDSPDVLKKYADDLGLTFDVASDSELSLSARFTTGSIPVTVVVDRFGKIVLQEAGARTSADDFLQLFDFLTSDYYTESVSLDGFPGPRAGVEGENAETLVSALGDDEHLTYLNPEDPFVWPMKAVEDGERLALSPSGPQTAGTRSSLSVLVRAQEGDVLAFDLKTACTDGVNLLTAAIDGTEAFALGGNTDWTSYALPLPEGEHTVTFTFSFRLSMNGSESILLDSFRLLSGEEAVQALAAKPAWPAAAALALTPASPASKLSFEDPSQTLPLLFGETDFYLVEDSAAHLVIELPEGMNPHKVVLYAPGVDLITTPAENFSGETYALDLAIPEDAESADGITQFFLYTSIEDAMNGIPARSLTLFPGRKTVDYLISYMKDYGFTLSLKE